MKYASSFQIGMTFAGCVLGAGFVSGQELWQFFGAHGLWSMAGAALAMLLFYLSGLVILRFARDSNEIRMDVLIAGPYSRALRAAVTAFELFFLFMLYLLMAAAAGALLTQCFGWSGAAGSALFCVSVTFLSFSGVRGLTRVFSFLVPVLVAATFLACLAAVAAAPRFPAPAALPHFTGRRWALDALVYVSFNMICSVPVLGPLGGLAKDAAAIRRGVLAGCLCLFGLSAAMLLALGAWPAVTDAELPMLALAAKGGRTAECLYACLLLGGIFGTGLSSQAALNDYLRQCLPEPRQLPFCAGFLAFLAFLGGLFGFRNLVCILYPVFGYIGILPLAMLFCRAFRFYRAARRKAGAQRAAKR